MQLFCLVNGALVGSVLRCVKQEAKRAKADVAKLKNNDAPLGLLLAAFQRQMASEQSDDEDADLSALHETGNERSDNDFPESTASRDTTSFYDTIEDNDSKYYSSKSNT